MTAHQWTQPEIADRLGLKRSHVYVMRHRGQLPAPSGRVGQSPWWAPDVIEPWMEAREQEAEARAWREGAGRKPTPGEMRELRAAKAAQEEE